MISARSVVFSGRACRSAFPLCAKLSLAFREISSGTLEINVSSSSP